MPGILADVKTSTRAITLDVKRLLVMGSDPSIGFYKADSTDPTGVVLLHQYTKGFSRVPEDEAEIGDGKTVIFDIADDKLPAGQLEDDIKDSDVIGVTQDGATQWFSITSSAKPPEGLARVYRLLCAERTFKKRYTRP
jgi:hypothetical protein